MTEFLIPAKIGSKFLSMKKSLKVFRTAHIKCELILFTLFICMVSPTLVISSISHSLKQSITYQLQAKKRMMFEVILVQPSVVEI